MKIAIAQLNYLIGDFDGNVNKIIKYAEEAQSAGADIVIFGELATCGYPPRDFLEFDDFIKQAEASIERLKKASQNIAIVVGSPSVNPVIEGKDLFNSAYFIADGEIKHIQNKALLPTYDVFDEYRYFEPASDFKCLEYKGKKIALTICEDIWNIGNENPLYTISPLDILIKESPDFIINVSASPFSYSHAEERIEVLKANVDRYNIPLFYSNNVGAQTELIFDGGSVAMSPNGTIHREMPYFKEALEIFDLEEVIEGEKHSEQPKDDILEIHDAIICGIKDYFSKLGFTKAILGLSGGIDSAVTAVLAQRALGKENVRVLLMPSQFSSDHSVNDAKQLAENLGIQYDIIKIESIYKSFLGQLDTHFEGLPFNVTEENIQARVRGTLLMAFSNKFGNILLNTSNKSEMAVGYGTLYGDLAGGISVLGDVYKTEVFALANYINKDKEVIPTNTITKPPSAELRPNQKDSDSLPDYDILDKILFEYIENRKGPNEIIEMGYDQALVKRILRLVNINEFKRYQTAPVLRVSSKAFGMGRRLPIVGKYLS
ncbi:MAG: NAD+ synthase [Saprospiraceae bacterium]|nr:NAD+ synthase [Bacteroidia bacterium]NNE13699.1 NAD+ synthase [Saprospiraceae bacterium]NNL90970.1 NAD+ synthase [Saprospiraceae bacterium]